MLVRVAVICTDGEAYWDEQKLPLPKRLIIDYL